MKIPNKYKTNLIKNWTIKQYGVDAVIWGKIYRDMKGRFADGTYIRTSRIEFIDFTKGLVKTKNSVYELDMEGADNEQREAD